jgi:hypothetical protein
VATSVMNGHLAATAFRCRCSDHGHVAVACVVAWTERRTQLTALGPVEGAEGIDAPSYRYWLIPSWSQSFPLIRKCAHGQEHRFCRACGRTIRNRWKPKYTGWTGSDRNCMSSQTRRTRKWWTAGDEGYYRRYLHRGRWCMTGEEGEVGATWL